MWPHRKVNYKMKEGEKENEWCTYDYEKEKYEMQTRMSDLMKRRVRRGAEKKVNTEEQKK